MDKERLGEILMRSGLLDEAGLQRALAEQQRRGGHLGRHLVALGLISEETLVRALSTQCKLPAVALDPMRIDPRVGRMLPQAMCERYGMLCFGFDERRRSVDIAMADPSSVEVIDAVSAHTRCSVRRYFAAPSAIERALALVFDSPAGAGAGIDLPPLAPLGAASAPAAAEVAPTQQALRRGAEAQPPRTPPPSPQAAPPPPPAAVKPAAAAVFEEIPLPEPSHVHITLDMPTMQKLQHKDPPEKRLTRVEDLLARDSKLLELLLGLFVSKGLLTREEVDKIFSRL